MAAFTEKRMLGMGAYALAGFAALARYRHPGIEVRLDDGTVDRGSFILVSNTRLYGAFFVFHPKADPTDGLLDVLVFRDSGRWRFLGLVAQMIWHGVAGQRSAPAFLARHGVYQTKSLQIVPGHQRSAQVDGESLPGGVVEIGISPGALKVLLPKRALRRSGKPHG